MADGAFKTKQKGPAYCRAFSEPANCLGQLHLFSLQAFLALGHGEGHLLTFLQALEACGLNRAEVNEYIVTAFISTDEAKTFGIVEPLYSTGFYLGHCHFLGASEAASRQKSWSQGEAGTTV